MRACAACDQEATPYRVRWAQESRTVHLCPEHARPITDLLDQYSKARPARRFADAVMTIDEIERLAAPESVDRP